MKTIVRHIGKKNLVAFLLTWILPVIVFAQHQPTADEEREQEARIAMFSEIAIGVIFVVAVVAFLVYKSKHDKKVRQKQLEQMQRIQASKRKAA